jgi:fatty-acyl-CoA synthase
VVVKDGEAQFGWLTRDVLQRQVALRPDKLAVQDLSRGRRLTYRQLDQDVARCDGLLQRLLTPGARVALLARNSIHHFTLFYACQRSGAIFQPLNWRLSGPELAVLIEDAQPELLIYEAEFESQATAAIASAAPHQLIRIDGDDDPLARLIAAEPPAPLRPIAPEAPCGLLYTSGTTGRPKGVIMTPRTQFFAALNYTFVGEMAPEHAQLCDVPMFHVVGLLAVMHGSLLAGATVHLSDRFAPADTLRRLADPALGVTHYFCVPQMAQALLEDPAAAGADLHGLRVFTGGAPMSAELTLALVERGVRPSNGYGMSENGTILGVPLDPEIARRKAGSAGIAAPTAEIRLVGPDGADVADREVGEVWLRGPSITPGYWNQPEATAKAFEGEWFRSGDAARRDADGFYFIVDRWKDMYITGGENVYPAEVEAVIAAMPQVAEAAVVGVPDSRWGECGCAYVVVRTGEACTADDVLAACDARLARYKRPSHVRFIEALPRTASGKIQKDNLRRLFAAEHEKTPA